VGDRQAVVAFPSYAGIPARHPNTYGLHPAWVVLRAFPEGKLKLRRAIVVGGLVIAVSYAGLASPLVVLIAFVASMCCASSIAEFGRRLPSADDPRQSQGIR